MKCCVFSASDNQLLHCSLAAIPVYAIHLLILTTFIGALPARLLIRAYCHLIACDMRADEEIVD